MDENSFQQIEQIRNQKRCPVWRLCIPASGSRRASLQATELREVQRANRDRVSEALLVAGRRGSLQWCARERRPDGHTSEQTLHFNVALQVRESYASDIQVDKADMFDTTSQTRDFLFLATQVSLHSFTASISVVVVLLYRKII